MKKIWLILLVLIVGVNCYAVNKYVAPAPLGNDANAGTLASPYLTFTKASTVAINPGDSIIFAAGTYNQANTQVVINVGVSVRGAGAFTGGTRINLLFSVAGQGGFTSGAVQLSSAVLNTNGNQSISAIWFDGSNFVCLNGVMVRCRSNVTISRCKFTNFGIDAINFYGKTTQTTGTPPPTFSQNNSVLNCSLFECSDRMTQATNNVSAGSIAYSGQRNILFQFDTLSNTTKPIGHNGNLFGAVQGNNIGAKWLNCMMTKPNSDGNATNAYNFGIESWYDQGGCIFAFNTYTGGGNCIDIGYGGANKLDSAYSWYIHDNLFTNPALLTSNSEPVLSIGVQFEPSKNVSPGCPCSSIPLNADIGDAIVRNNYFKNIGTMVQVTLNNYAPNFCDNLYIDHNVGESMGYANNTYSGVFNFNITLGTRIDSVFIDNNTIVGSHTGTIPGGTGTVGAPKAILIVQPDVGAITDFYFRNNIALYGTGYGYLLFRGNNPTNRFKSQNNIVFQNAFANNPNTFTYSAVSGSFIVGKSYTILNAGTTNFVAQQGAANNNPGTIFTAIAVGTGTGSATFNASNITPQNFTNTGNLKVDPLFVAGSSPVNYHLASGSPGISGGLNPPATYIGAYPPGTITPVITWANPADITFGTALSGTQLNATSGGVPGTFAYSPATGTVLNAGLAQTLSVTFTPTDLATYSVVSKSVTINVNKATATLTYSNLTQTYTGLPLNPTITTTPAGLGTLSTTYNGVGTIPTIAGSYTVVTGLTNANYTATPITATFTINKATATINVGNLLQVYDGTQKSVTASTSPVGLTGLSITYDGSPTAPTNAGSYAVAATLTNANYQATPFSGTLVIGKATPTVSWSNPAAITYGTALSGTQLNATASVAGTFTYIPASGVILNAGTNVLTVNFTPTDAANYNSVNGTSVSIVVNQATAIISLSNLAQIYDGTGKSATATTNPVGLGVITITYNGSATLPINAGSYTVNATLSNSNYTATPATGTLVISKATAVLSITNDTYTYDGTPKSVSVSTVPVGLTAIVITYNGSLTVPTSAGSYAVIATLANTNYSGSVNGTLTINKATPVISWSNPSNIVYGTALSGTQLNASTTIAGTFTYSPPSGTVLSAGTYTLSVNFTPSDATNYNAVNGTTVTLTVTQATAIINLSNLVQDFDGNPKPVTVSTTPLGLGVITVLYNGSATVPSAVGSYGVHVTLTNGDYIASPVNGTLVINAVSAAINITNINQTYTGSPLPVTVTTIPPGLSHTTMYNGSATVPTNAGSYTVIATINDGIHTGADTATFIIAKANPVITWTNPSSIVYGTALSATQLNATTPVAGTFTYSPPSGTILNVGTQPLSTSFSPTDATNYNTIPVTTVSIIVTQATATITTTNITQQFDGNPKPVTVTTNPIGLGTLTTTYAGNPTAPSAIGTYQVITNLSNTNYTAKADTVTLTISTASAQINISNINQVYTGSPLPVTVTTNPNGLTYTVTYNASATVPTNVGSYTVIATITGGIYTGADTETLVISKATPVIVWANPANIVFGTALSGTQLNASTSVAGTFVYTPPSGTVLSAGVGQSLSTTFTPTDASNYNSVTKIVSITVTPSTSASMTFSNTSQVYNGTPRSVTVTTSPANLSGVTITYNGSLIPPTNAGSYTLAATLTNDNYTAPPITGILTISKAIPILAWAIPAQITFGTPLTSLQLNASSNVPGVFSYNPSFGVQLQAGTTALTATFIPTDNVNYAIATITVPLSVNGGALLLYFIEHGATFFDNLPGQVLPP